MKKAYYLKVIDNVRKEGNYTTGDIILRKGFSDMERDEAIREATMHLKDTKEFQGKYHSKLQISLMSISKDGLWFHIEKWILKKRPSRFKVYTMQWNSSGLSDGTGHFDEWIPAEYTSKVQKNNLKASIFAIIIFTLLFLIYFFIQLSLHNNEDSEKFIQHVTSIYYVTSLIYLSIFPLLKGSFIKITKFARYIVLYIFALEAPFIVATLYTLYLYFESFGLITFTIVIFIFSVLATLLKIYHDYRSELRIYYKEKLR